MAKDIQIVINVSPKTKRALNKLKSEWEMFTQSEEFKNRL